MSRHTVKNNLLLLLFILISSCNQDREQLRYFMHEVERLSVPEAFITPSIIDVLEGNDKSDINHEKISFSDFPEGEELIEGVGGFYYVEKCLHAYPIKDSEFANFELRDISLLCNQLLTKNAILEHCDAVFIAKEKFIICVESKNSKFRMYLKKGENLRAIRGNYTNIQDLILLTHTL